MASLFASAKDGEATKVARWLLLEDKGYTGIIRLGSTTDTLDRTGAVVQTVPVPAVVPAPAAVFAFYKIFGIDANSAVGVGTF